jgi:hypothetical protein
VRPINIKGIAFENLDPRLIAPALAKVANQGRIEFDRANTIRAPQQVFRQSAAAGADLHSQSSVIAVAACGDPLQNLVADEEVLAEFLTRQFCGRLFLSRCS